jgi:hypothetical protein
MLNVFANAILFSEVYTLSPSGTWPMKDNITDRTLH